jgi:hypothetical protein
MGSMEVLTAEQVERVYRLTDSLLLHRDWVVVPLGAHPVGLEMELPDGKVLVRPPGGPAFDPWLAGLGDRLRALNLDRALRAGELERHYPRTPAGAAPGSGARRYVKPT